MSECRVIADIVLRLRERSLVLGVAHDDRLSAHLMDYAAAEIEALRAQIVCDALHKAGLTPCR